MDYILQNHTTNFVEAHIQTIESFWQLLQNAE